MIDHVHVSMSIEENIYRGFRNLAMLQDKKISQIVEQLMRSYVGEHEYRHKKPETKYGCTHTAPTYSSQNNPEMMDYDDNRNNP
jgi:metal-responsive CopG/Arc/MetJ family transcriptional regulator